ncbi:hypothetical protein ACP4OV_001905 [Aristida adscensionis]
MELGIVCASMKPVLAKLKVLLSEDHTMLRDVRNEVECIYSKLVAAHAFFLGELGRAGMGSDGHDDDTQMESWGREARDVAHDVEVCVDHLRLQLSRRPEPADVRGLLSTLRRAWYVTSTLRARRGVAAQIIALKARAQRLPVHGEGEGEGEGEANYGVASPQLSGYGSGDDLSSSRRVDQSSQPSALLMGAEEPVGMEEPVADLRPWFTAPEQERRVVAIVGCGGLGKTTLAGALRRKFAGEFKSAATVLASRGFNLGAFLRSLLKQIMSPFDYDELQLGGRDAWKDVELRQKVEEQFLQKRYIVVIDDLRTVSAWESIWQSLPENGMGSLIIVTTRLPSLAEFICRQHGYVYNLNPLNASDSLCLLQRNLDHTHLCLYGADTSASRILDKCGGLPLAIVVVAGLLANQLESDSILTRVCEEIRSEQNSEGTPEDVMRKIILYCFSDLPADLRTCLLCLSIFPIGFSISRKRLIRRWITEGFITQKNGKTVDQVAEETFSELITRKLIQPVETKSNEKVKTFQVHSVILENIVSKSSEENFISVVDGYSPGLAPKTNKVRLLSIHTSSSTLHANESKKSTNLSDVRSFTAFGSGTTRYLASLAIVQVLDLDGCVDLSNSHLILICNMNLLKYLNLRRTYIKALPPRIAGLQKLETLDIRETNISRLPRSVGKLKNMVHLLSGDRGRGLALEFTKEITRMSGLQTLSGIKIHQRSAAAPAGICNLNKLNKLSIAIYGIRKDNICSKKRWDDDSVIHRLLSHCFSLKSLAIDDGFTGFHDRLNSLPALFYQLNTLNLSGKLSHVPDWIQKLSHLEELTLSLTSLGTRSLDLLYKLPALRFLKFSIDAAKKHACLLAVPQEIFVPSCGFERLHVLRFSGDGLPLLTFLEGATPGLQSLELRFKIFDGIYGLGNLGGLQKVQLEVSKQASQVTMEKVRQVKGSLDNHPKGPRVIYNEYSEW